MVSDGIKIAKQLAFRRGDCPGLSEWSQCPWKQKKEAGWWASEKRRDDGRGGRGGRRDAARERRLHLPSLALKMEGSGCQGMQPLESGKGWKMDSPGASGRITALPAPWFSPVRPVLPLRLSGAQRGNLGCFKPLSLRWCVTAPGRDGYEVVRSDSKRCWKLRQRSVKQWKTWKVLKLDERVTWAVKDERVVRRELYLFQKCSRVLFI